MPSIADDDPDWAGKVAWQMAQDRFQYHKCAFGTTEGTHEKFRIKIPDFPTSRDFPDAYIEKKYMTFTRYVGKSIRRCGDSEIADKSSDKTCANCLTNNWKRSIQF